MKTPDVGPNFVRSIPLGAEATWSALPGLGVGAWLMRRPDLPDLVVRRASEVEVMATRSGALLQVAPQVVAAADGWLAVERIEGVHVTGLELSRPGALLALGGMLRRLHSGDIDLPEARLCAARNVYTSRIPSNDFPPALSSALRDASMLEAELMARSPVLVPAHLDVVANVLVGPAGYRLIDFEYAAAAPAARELGQVVWEAELDRPAAERLRRAYGEESGVTSEAITTWAWVAGVTWTLWALSRPAIPSMSVYARRSVERLTTFWGSPTQ